MLISSVQEQCHVYASQRLERETSEERGDVLSKPNRRPHPAMGGREARSLWRLPLLMVLQVRFNPDYFTNFKFEIRSKLLQPFVSTGPDLRQLIRGEPSGPKSIQS